MATIFGEITGIQLLTETMAPLTGTSALNVALISFELGAYAASADNGQLGGGGLNRGTATTQTLAQIIAGQRRDGKTVTLANATNGLGMTARPGRQAATQFHAGNFAVSSGSITFNVTNAGGTEIDAAAGVRDAPITALVAYTV